MSDIKELAAVPELNFIDHMSLKELENQLLFEYRRRYRELTGEEITLAEADPKTLLLRTFALIEYQTMQYIDAKGRAELLKTATGPALDALAALLGITRLPAAHATVPLRFTLSAPRPVVTAIPAGTRVKTAKEQYFNTLSYAEIPAGGEGFTVTARAEEAGAGSSGIPAGEICLLVDPVPYLKEVSNPEPSAGGVDTEDDDALTLRTWLAPSKFSSAGPKDAYEYYVREWRSDVADVAVVSPAPCEVAVYVVLEGGGLPSETERAELVAHLSADTVRPLCDKVSCLLPEEIDYEVSLTWWIGRSDALRVTEIEAAVRRAVEEFARWQRTLGRDVNPTELIARLRAAGAKRVRLAAPQDIPVSKTALPRLARTELIFGGVEDD
ncbi:MAG: baseplate J/gp47 family protein [Clostridia bacterium]|nr:baseplate J/gp47 family protein [Clostridia bacterium]